MPEIRFTGTYLINCVYEAVFKATGRSEYFDIGDISVKDVLGKDTEVGIYLETPVKDIPVPYITIRQLDTDKKQDNYRHFWRSALFVIEYVPDDREQSKNIEMLEISEIVLAYLTDIETPTGVKLHARSLKSEIVGGVLFIYADYKQLTEVPEPDDPTMETLEQNVLIKDKTKGMIK